MKKPEVIVNVDVRAYSAVAPMAAAAAKRGIGTVLVCDRKAGVPDPSPYAEILEVPSFDAGTLREALRGLAERYEIRGLTGWNLGWAPGGLIGTSIGTLCDELGLPGPGADAFMRATNKFLTRDALHAAGVPDVRFALATDEASLLEGARHVGYPLILKPITGNGSSFILKCSSDDELRAKFALAMERLPQAYYRPLMGDAHEWADRAGRVRRFDPIRSMLMEQYIPGREGSVECVVADGVPRAVAVHDKVGMREGERVFFEDVLVSPPERFTEREAGEMREYALAVVRAMGLRNALCHVELRYLDGHGPRLLEINPRIGSGTWYAMQTLAGFDPFEAGVDLALGTLRPSESYRMTGERHSLMFLFSGRSGHVQRVDGQDEARQLPGMIDLKVGAKPGLAVGGDNEEIFLASAWVKAPTAAAAMEAHRRLTETLRIEIA